MPSCCRHDSKFGQLEKKGDEVKYWEQHFWQALLWSIPLFILSMAMMLFSHRLPFFVMTWGGWLQFFLTLPILFLAGAPIWKRGMQSFSQRSLNMFSLIVVGMAGTFLYSSWQLIIPSSQLYHDFYFEAVAMIVVLVLLGQFLEVLGRKKSGMALQELLEAVPTTAVRLLAHKEKETSVSSLHRNDLIRIRPGEKIPADGTLVEGSSFVDESLLTGESFPVEKEKGSLVHAGTLNGHGSFVMRVEQVGMATMLGQMSQIVLRAQQHRAPVQKIADRLATKIVPLVFIIATMTFFGWYFFHPELGGAFAFARALSVVMITCPCALGLATPLALMVGIGSAARGGILVRDAVALEQLTAATMVVFDKTGTLTEGKFEVVGLKNFSTMPNEEWLSILAAAERGSEHPLGDAILRYAEAQRVIKKEASFFEAVPGGGLRAAVEGKDVLVGSKKFLEKEKIDLSRWDSFFQKQKATTVALVIDRVLISAILLNDRLKSDATEVVSILIKQGFKVAMLTGDYERVAQEIADKLGITIWKAALSPQEKAVEIQAWQQAHEKIVMIGDGINDAPALSVADVSLAVHRGSNLAKETADIILMKPSLKTILSAHAWSNRTMSVVRQNLFFAFAYNFLAIPMAAGLFFSSFGLLLNPMWATAAMSLSSLSVVGNSLRLRNAGGWRLEAGGITFR